MILTNHPSRPHPHLNRLERRGMHMIMLDPVTAITLQWLFVSLALIAVLLRAYNRWRTSNRLCPTDGIIPLALAMFAAGVSLNTFQYSEGDWGNTAQIPWKKAKIIYKMTFASFFLFYTVLWTVKLTLIMIYSALFPSSLVRLRLVVKATWYFTLLSFVFSLAMNLFYCGEPSSNWRRKTPTSSGPVCVSYRGGAYITTLALHLVTEIIIFFLPFTLLHHFRSSLSTADSVRVACVFALGILGTVATIVRILCFVVDSPPQVITTWLSLEQAVAVTVVCSPAMKKSFMKAMHASLNLIIDAFRQSLRVKRGGGDGRHSTNILEIGEVRAMKEAEALEMERRGEGERRGSMMESMGSATKVRGSVEPSTAGAVVRPDSGG